jgi:nitronate monooxygenase/enoyl-[acyl-carrier protein] reductase II
MRTAFTELLGLETPIVQASIGPWTNVELTAAACEAGALGSIGTSLVAPDRLRAMLAELRDRTDRPFAVNHTRRPFSEEAFAIGLEADPAVVSLAIGEPGDLVARTHDAGALFMAQVHTVEQALRAVEQGADILIAQGGEAGGFCGDVATMALVPQVVDAVAPVPVLAAGGIADGRGLAAALVLGAAGVNIGTRFLATVEALVPERYKARIVAAASQDAVKVGTAPFPPVMTGGYVTAPRALRTPFIESGPPAEAADELIAAVRADRADELVPFAGQTVGLIDDVVPVRGVVEAMVADARAVLAAVSAVASGVAPNA